MPRTYDVSKPCHLRLRRNDLLICDASDHAIKTEGTGEETRPIADLAE
jgi:hypothetical protein